MPRRAAANPAIDLFRQRPFQAMLFVVFLLLHRVHALRTKAFMERSKLAACVGGGRQVRARKEGLRWPFELTAFPVAYARVTKRSRPFSCRPDLND